MASAAKKLAVSQPAVSKSIRLLEGAVGQDLFQRRPGQLTLTPAGVKLHAFAQSLFSNVENLEQELAHQDELSGVLRIGTYESLGETIWPGVLSALKKTYPHLLVHLETEGNQSVWTKLKSGALDLVVDAEPSPVPAFVSKVLYKDSFQVYRSTRMARDLSEVLPPFAYVESASDRNGVGIREHLQARGIEHRLAYSVQSFPFVRSLILKGVCHGVLPTQLAANDVSEGRLVPFEMKEKRVVFGEHRICATYPEFAEDSSKIRAVLDALRSARR